MCEGGCGSKAAQTQPGACQNRFGGAVTYDDTGSGLNFTRPIASASPVIATGGGPGYGVTQLPTSMVTVTPQMVGYQDFYSGADADGMEQVYLYNGAYGQLYQANKAGA